MRSRCNCSVRGKITKPVSAYILHICGFIEAYLDDRLLVPSCANIILNPAFNKNL
jgi:hypothetical protein